MTNNEAIIRTAEQPNSRTAEQPNSRTSNFPLVSIIIPAYNTAPYIHRAIESSLKQTHKNVEVIIVDDGSTDDTLSVAQKYESEDARVRVFHQDNAGVSAARNHALCEAKGKYITFLDSDDWLEDDAVDSLLTLAENYPNKFIVSEIYDVSFDPQNSNIFRRIIRTKVHKLRVFTIEEVFYAIPDIITLNIPAKLLRLDIIRQHNIHFEEGLRYGEDQLFMFEYLAKTNGLVFLNKPLVNILSRQSSAVHVPYLLRGNDHVDPIKVMIDHPAMNDNPQNSLAVQKAIRMRFCRALMFRISNTIKGNGSYEAIKSLQKESKDYAHEYLASDKVSFIRKLDFFCAMYLPVPLAKLSVKLLRAVNDLRKSRKSKREEEIIPYW